MIEQVLKAITVIETFLNTQGEFLTTTSWRAKDGTILKTDWGYFEDGVSEIKKYLERDNSVGGGDRIPPTCMEKERGRMSEYKSPIQIWVSELGELYEDEVLKAVQKYKIDVDKTELIKALKYDRGQYDKGYEDGYKAKDIEIVRCKDCIHRKPRDSMYSLGFNDKVVISWQCQYMFENQDDDFCSYGERFSYVESEVEE